MLKKHKKTFDLNKERRGQQSYDNRLYWRKKWKYLKYVIIPCIILLILLFILVNVDFSKKISDNNLNKETNSSPAVYINSTICDYFNSSLKRSMSKVLEPKSTITGVFLKTADSVSSTELSEIKESRNGIQNIQNDENDLLQLSASYLVIDSPQDPLAGVIPCTEYIENCTLHCIDGSVSYIDENLEKLQTKCKNFDLSLIVEKCEFALGLLQQSFFFGSFSLGYFSINNCNLKTIKAATFKHNNAKNIQTLILRNNQLVTLDASCFEGLSNLIHFEFVQMPLSEVFKGNGFLKPFTNNLQNAVLQPIVNGTEVVDPMVWWQDLKIITLINLDLSNTHLQGVINSNTFQAFEALEYLSLYNCNLLSITATTFDNIFDTLTFLDLRYNHFQTLDFEFLEKFTFSGIEMDLGLNDWYCDCDIEMLQYFTQQDSPIAKDMVCTAPKKWQQMEIIEVVEECRESETTTTSKNPGTYSMIPPISTTTSPTTISTTNATPTAETTHTVTVSSTEDSRTFSVNPNSQTTTPIEEPITTTTPIKPPLPTEVTTYTTTTTKPIVPPIVPPYLLLINCYSNKENDETFSKFIAKPNGNFSILSSSPGMVQINLVKTTEIPKLNLIYFTNYSDYKTKDIDAKDLTVYIDDLKLSNVYVFCLVAEPALTVSPFDCLGYYVLEAAMKTSWLVTPDKVWFITASFIIALLLFLLTIFSVYIFLRQNPIWLLHRNKRILQVHNSSRKVLLVSKKSRLPAMSANQSPISQRSSNYLKSLPPIQESGNYDIESSLYSSQLTAPTVNAPILIPLHQTPKARISRKLYNSSCSPVNNCRRHLARNSSQNMDYLDVIENDPDYQSIDHYETVN